MEFVRDLDEDETNVRLVRGIVGLAREFDQITVAEGVEDEATVRRLRELGVDHAQGFHFARPAPVDASAVATPTGSPCARRPPSAHRPDVLSLVRDVFTAFASMDTEASLALCHPGVQLRPFATSRRTARDGLYAGHAGLRDYLDDVRAVWTDLKLVPPVSGFELLAGSASS